MLAKLISALAVAVALTTTTQAQTQENTLDQIISRGELRVATSFSTPPYGITDEKMQPAGFDIDIAHLIARDLGVKLKLVDVSSQARIPTLTGGDVDIIISSFGITAERAKAVMYSNAIYVDTQTIIAPVGTKMDSYKDIVGRKIGVTRGTTNDTLLTDNALPGTNILRYEDAAGGNQALISGQIDGLVSGTAAAFTIMKRTDKYEAKFPMRSSPMGIGVRKGDFDLLRWLNSDIMLLWNSGEIQTAQKKWIGSVNEDLPDYWF